MAFLPTSRYSGVLTVQTTAARRRPVTALVLRRLPAVPDDTDAVTVQPHDRIDVLAHERYGDSSMSWRIADANSELEARRLIEPGRIIRVSKPA